MEDKKLFTHEIEQRKLKWYGSLLQTRLKYGSLKMLPKAIHNWGIAGKNRRG